MHDFYLIKRIVVFILLKTTAAVNCYCQPATAPAAYTAAISLNYVRTWDATAPQTDPALLLTASLREVKQTTQYFDGLGRPVQTVVRQGSLITGGAATDMVSSNLYDALGREQYKYLPFAANSTGGNTSIADGNFKLNPFQQDSVFNKAKFAGETYYYTQTVFEASPLSRPMQSFAPGNSWVGSKGTGTERAVSNQYLLNTAADSVRIWTIAAATSSLPTSSAFYAANLLYENVIIDENGKKLVEYKDREGKVILKKVQLSNTPSTAHAGWLCTYYIYDIINNLRFVIQPRATEFIWSNWTVTTAIANELCFRYEYDTRNRMIIKDIPGAGETWMVYDARDRMVMTQDSNLRAQGKWIVTEYDTLNRPLRTNLWTNSSNRSIHQTAAYNSIIYPTISGTNELLSETYYDNYSWVAGSGTTLTNLLDSTNTKNSNYFNTTYNTSPVYAQPVTASYLIKGMPTGSKVKVLGTASQYLYSLSFYDDKGRVIQIQSINVTVGKDISTMQYDWSGKAIRNYVQHTKRGTLPQNYSLVTKMDYDDAGRLLTVKKTFYGDVEKTITSNSYDELGQLKNKILGNNIDSLKYDYNIRGWLLGVNRSYLSYKGQGAANKFGFELVYDKQNSFTGQNYTATQQYNGNITGIAWKNDGDDVRRIYNFAYDNVNRLMKADFKQQNPTNYTWSNTLMDYSIKMGDGTNATSAYDANGNILKMVQYGWKLGVAPTVPIDNLTYNYIANSNKLLQVTDTNNDISSKLGDFKYDPATKTSTDYSYDCNGNLSLDNNKKISSIAYNYLNLPNSITVAAKGTIAYTYDATGKKLKKITTEDAKVTTTLYLDAFNYVNDSLQFVSHEEGRIRPHTIGNVANGVAYDYMLRDHLGNIRMLLTDQLDTSFYPAASLETATLGSDTTYYSNITNTRVTPLPVGYPASTPAGNAYAAKLSSTTGGNKIGPGITLKVMAGDKFNVTVNSFWNSAATAQAPVNPLADLINALANGIAGAGGGKAAATQLQSTAVLSPGATNFLNSQSPPASKPKAYLNWVLFDEQFNIARDSAGNIMASGYSNAVPVGNSGTLTPLIFSNQLINKSGYLYIYVSNETPNIDVFFDQLQVTHIRGPIMETNEFYPFGLTMSGISSKSAGSLTNRYKYNGKELNNQEFSDGSGLELYDYGARMYDQQIGRWGTVDPLTHETPFESPYSAMGNNPILNIDPDGQSWEPVGKDGKVVQLSDKENINGYRWVGYDKDDKGNMVARANTVETAYTFGEKGMTTLSSEGYKANKNWQAYEDISTGDKSTDKKLATLHPDVQNQMKSLILMSKNRFDIDLRVTDGFRSVAEQDKLYAKGRTAPGSIVTKARGGYSNHNFGLAVDVVPFENGKLNWDTKNYPLIGRIGINIGLEWGGNWKFVDKPHFQNLFGKSLKELRALPKDANGLPIIK